VHYENGSICTESTTLVPAEADLLCCLSRDAVHRHYVVDLQQPLYIWKKMLWAPENSKSLVTFMCYYKFGISLSKEVWPDLGTSRQLLRH